MKAKIKAVNTLYDKYNIRNFYQKWLCLLVLVLVHQVADSGAETT